MSKKDFKGGLNSLIEGTQKTGAKKELSLETAQEFIAELKKGTRGRPKTVFKDITKSSQQGTKVNETRATFILNEELLEKLKAIAYWDRVLIKEVINTALQEYVTKTEKKSGEIKPIPNR